MSAPAWLSLLSPLPPDVRPARKPVASAQQIAAGSAGPIAGWQNVTVDVSQPDVGLRHVQITLDESGALLAASDHVMFVRETAPDDPCIATLTDHESIGGRFELDGSFRGTCWKSRLKSDADSEDAETISSEHSAPTPGQVAMLRAIIADVLARTPQE